MTSNIIKFVHEDQIVEVKKQVKKIANIRLNEIKKK